MTQTSERADAGQIDPALERVPGVPGLPLPEDYRSFRWGWAPQGLATIRQLRSMGLRPVKKQEPVSEIRWRRGERVAYLHRVDEAIPVLPPTAQQSAALAAAMRARKTCTECGIEADYVLPTRFTGSPQCLDCLEDTNTRTSNNDWSDDVEQQNTSADPGPGLSPVAPADGRQATLARLQAWERETAARQMAQADLVAAGDQKAATEMRERGSRHKWITQQAVLPLEAARGTLDELGWEMDHEGGRGPFAVVEPGLPVRVLDRLTFLGWSPEQISELVADHLDEAGNTTTEAMVRVVHDLAAADGADFDTVDEADIESVIETMHDQSLDPSVLVEAEMQASVEDAYRAAQDGAAPAVGWAPHHGEAIPQVLADWWEETGLYGTSRENGGLAKGETSVAGVSAAGVRSTVDVEEEQPDMWWKGLTANDVTAGDAAEGSGEVESPSPFVRDPLNPTDEELQAAIQRGIERGDILTWDDFVARHGNPLDDNVDQGGVVKDQGLDVAARAAAPDGPHWSQEDRRDGLDEAFPGFDQSAIVTGFEDEMPWGGMPRTGKEYIAAGGHEDTDQAEIDAAEQHVLDDQARHEMSLADEDYEVSE